MVRSDEWMLMGGVLPITHRPPEFYFAIHVPPKEPILSALAETPADKGREAARHPAGIAATGNFAEIAAENPAGSRTLRRPGTTGVMPCPRVSPNRRSTFYTSCRCRRDKTHCGESRPYGRFSRDNGWRRPDKPIAPIPGETG